MRLKYFLSLLVVAGSTTFGGAVSAQQTNVQTINDSLPYPFNLLSVPLDWKLIDIFGNINNDDHPCELEFQSIYDANVSFEIFVSKPLKEDISLEALEIQIKNAIPKKGKTIPILEHKKLGKFEWLHCTSKGKIKRSSHEVTEVVKTTNLVYLTIVNDRVVAVDFTAPREVFNDYLPLFEETMNIICQ
jgi:hypothetical protein